MLSGVSPQMRVSWIVDWQPAAFDEPPLVSDVASLAQRKWMSENDLKRRSSVWTERPIFYIQMEASAPISYGWEGRRFKSCRRFQKHRSPPPPGRRHDRPRNWGRAVYTGRQFSGGA